MKNQRYREGPIDIVGVDRINCAYSVKLPLDVLSHGRLTRHKTYKHRTKIVGVYGDLYAVSYIDDWEAEVILGFEQDVLFPVAGTVMFNTIDNFSII